MTHFTGWSAADATRMKGSMLGCHRFTALAALVSLVAVSAPVRAADTPNAACRLSGRVVATSIAGCDASPCAKPEEQARLLRLANLGAGRTVQPTDVAQAVQRLKATGLFSNVTAQCERLGEAGLDVAIAVVPHVLVHRVRVEGNQYFRDRDVLKRVFLRSGTPLTIPPGSAPDAAPQIARQRDAIARLYAKAGLDDIDIVSRVDPISPYAVDLTFAISEGERERIQDIVIRHTHRGTSGHAPASDLVCPQISQRRLERIAGVTYGDVQTANLRRSVRERLKHAFQSAGYVRPRIVDDAAPEPSRISQTVSTRQCWLLRVWQRDVAAAPDGQAPSFHQRDPVDPDLAARDADGAPFKRVPFDEWRDALPFGESGIFDVTEAARGANAIRRDLVAKGFSFADVRLRFRRFEPSTPPGDVRGTIDFFVTLNGARRIHHIELPGVQAFDTDTLLEAFDTQVYDFFGAPGIFSPERVAADLARLQHSYREQGFYDMRFAHVGDPSDVAPQRVIHASSRDETVWRYGFRDVGFLLKKRRGDPALTIVAPLSEGPRTTLAGLRFSGNTRFSDVELATRSGLAAGAPYGRAPLRDALEAIQDAYRELGYYHARIHAHCTIPAPGAGTCDVDDIVSSEAIELTFDIHEGPEVFVGEVFTRGNFTSDRHALVRDLPRSGEPLSARQLDEATRRMRTLGIFNAARVDIIGLDELPPPERVALVVSVEEAGTRFLDVAAGVRSIQRQDLEQVPPWVASTTGNLVAGTDQATTSFGRAQSLDIPDVLVLLELEYLDLNVWGLGHHLRLPTKIGLSFSQFLRFASFDPTYVWPRLLDSQVRLELRAIAELDRVTDPLDRLELGAEADISIPISRRVLAGLKLRGGVIKLKPPGEPCLFCLQSEVLGIGTSLPTRTAGEVARGAVCTDQDASTGDTCSDEAFRPQFSVSLGVRWDQQDNPLHATRGFAIAGSTSFILDRDRDSDTVIFNRFLKWELSARVAIHLRGPILALFARYGGSESFDADFLPANERYTLGGSNGLRGFVDNGVCRYLSDGALAPDCPTTFGGNVVLNASAELRVPIIERLGIWAAAFVDVGALAQHHRTLYPASFRGAGGIGIRWLLGNQIPIRLDVGFPFERRCVDHTDGGCRREDGSALHFDFLYPF